MEESTKSLIHQTLHGYADGHTLLATSCDLTAVEKSTLLLLSDLSGQAGNRSFDAYLTGYPLPGKRFYALAKTWYAPEMSRPGCVWTQTLLIALPLLTRIRNLSELTELFKRPQLNSEINYSEPILAEQLLRNTFSTLYKSNHSFYTIAYHLYNSPRESIVIPAKGAAEYEEDILSIWNQQWPRLRRSFSFCTGSLSIRKINEKTLDCQVIPDTYNFRLLRQHTSSINVVDFNAINKPVNWFSFYESIDSRELQAFMYKYGSDITGKRSKFAPLCLAYNVLYHKQGTSLSFDILLEFFKQYFSSASEAKRLKQDLIKRLIVVSEDGEYNFIKALLTSPYTSTLPNLAWNLPEQIVRLWSAKQIDGIGITRLLEELDTNRLDEQQKRYLLCNLPVELWIDVRWVTAELLSELINVQPQIIEQPSFWKSSISNQRTAVEAITTYTSDFLHLKRVIYAMLEVRNDRWSDTLSSAFDALVLLASLDWMLDKPNADLPQNWKNLIWRHPHEYLLWLASTKHYTQQTTDLMLHLFVEKSFQSDLLDKQDVATLISQLPKLPSSSLRNQAMSIWLAKGLYNEHPAAQEITALLFQPVYDIVRQDNLDNFSWHILAPSYERTTKSFGFSSLVNWFFSESKPHSPDWDKCGQLRQKLVESCILFTWPSAIICRAITDADTFERTMAYSLQFDSGKKLFSKVFVFIQQHSAYKSSFYGKIIESEAQKPKRGKGKRR